MLHRSSCFLAIAFLVGASEKKLNPDPLRRAERTHASVVFDAEDTQVTPDNLPLSEASAPNIRYVVNRRQAGVAGSLAVLHARRNVVFVGR